MGERTSYAPGTFSWAELLTSDADAAKAFYTSIFGWEYRDNPVGEGRVYSTALRDGKDVGALYAAEQPPHWNCYVTVESADASAARAAELGATIAAEPFDIFDVGRIGGHRRSGRRGAVPVGAQAPHRRDAGQRAGRDGLERPAHARPGGVGALLRRPVRLDDGGDPGRRRLPRDPNGERSNGGMMPLDPRMGAVPPNWMPYFGHEDVERLLGEVAGLGGQVLNGPVQVPGGHVRRAHRSAGRDLRGLDRRLRRLRPHAAGDLAGAARRRDPEPPAVPGARLSRTSSLDDPRAMFAAHGWGGTWVSTVFDFHHFHSTSHEALAVLSGQRDDRARRSAGRGVRGRRRATCWCCPRARATAGRATAAASGSWARTRAGRRTTTCCARPTTPRARADRRRSVRRRTTRVGGGG